MAYVYSHIRLDNYDIVYIGIGSDKQYRRAFDKTKRNLHWKNLTAKHPIRVDFLYDNLTWDEACKKEIELIAIHGRTIDGGTLCNITKGGEGQLGVFISEEIKAKIVAKATGRKASDETKAKLSHYANNRSAEHNYKIGLSSKGRIPSIETRLKISIAGKGNKHSLGVKPSEETKKKIAEAGYKSVICLNNNIVYKSINEAASILSLDNSAISKVVRGKINHTKGYHFKLLNN